MDSPLLPTIRGGPREMDDTFADMSLSSALSPGPPSQIRPPSGPSSSSSRPTGPGHAGVYGRPPPTRTFDETPDPPRGMMQARPRQSIFPPPGSVSRSSTKAKATTEPTAPVSSTPRGSSQTEAEGGDDEADVTIHAGHHAEEQASGAGVQDKQESDAGLTSEERAKRDEKLKDSLYELRGINDTFEVFLHALESARGHNERLALRVKETSTLLDQYTALLGQTDHTHRLLSNPNWTGADDNPGQTLMLQDIRLLEAEQAARIEAERERARVAEEAARREEEEKERKAVAAEAAARSKDPGSTRGGARGRGLPSSRGGIPRARGSGIPAPSARTVSGGKPPPTVRKAPSGLGLAGQYANVKSSGYGPTRKAT